MTYIVIDYKKVVRCDYCSEEITGEARDAFLAGWDWITGKNPTTRHACPECVPLPEWAQWKRETITEPAPHADAEQE